MTQQTADLPTPQAGEVPIVDLTGLVELLDRQAAELRDAADRSGARASYDPAVVRLRAEARRAADLLDNTRRMLDGRLL